MELETYLAKACNIPISWLAFFIFCVALLFSSFALIFLFVRLRVLAAQYSEKQVIITNENLKGSRSERIFNGRIRTRDAYRYVDAKKQLHEPTSYVSTLDLLPYPEFYANEGDQQSIFRRLVKRHLVVQTTTVAYEMNNRFRTSFLITDVPRINSKKVMLAITYPFLVAIASFSLKGTALQRFFDDDSRCYSKSWWLPLEIPWLIIVLLSCATIVGALIHCRNSILHSGKNK